MVLLPLALSSDQPELRMSLKMASEGPSKNFFVKNRSLTDRSPGGSFCFSDRRLTHKADIGYAPMMQLPTWRSRWKYGIW